VENYFRTSEVEGNFRKQVCAEEDGRSLCTTMLYHKKYPPTLPLENEPSGNERQ